MAGPVVEFTEEGRNKLAKFVGFSHWFCVLPSFICLLTALYIQIIIEDKIQFIEDYNGAVLPGFLIFTGLFGLIAHILCGKAAFSNRRPEKRGKWIVYLLPALIATVVIFLSEFISGIMCFVHIRDLEESFDSGIKSAMEAYKNDVVTKEEMDLLQMTYECCGSKSYSDWFYLRWIHPDYVNPLKAKLSFASFGEGMVEDDVPFSCCTPHVLRPCIHHHVHDNDLHFNYDYRTSTTLHTMGCTTKLMAFYEDSVLTTAGATVLALSFIQLVIIISLRFLQTSVITVTSSGDREGPSVGYLFNAPPTGTDIDTTVTSTEAETLLDSTADATFSQDDDEFGEERYVSVDGPEAEPIYENMPPFEPDDAIQPENEDEHIYNEGEVDEYLASRFATSKQLFEPGEEADYECIDESFPTPETEQIDANIHPSMTGSMHRSKPSLTKVRSDYGSYMAMNISNSSWSPQPQQSTQKVPKRQRKHRKDVKRYSIPRPTSGPRDTYVINMAKTSSPKLERIFSKHRSPERKHLLRGHRSLSSEPRRLFKAHRHVSPERTRLLETNRHLSQERRRQLGTYRSLSTERRRLAQTHSHASPQRRSLLEPYGYFGPEKRNVSQPSFRDRSPIKKSSERIVSPPVPSSQTNIPRNISPHGKSSARRTALQVSPVMLGSLVGSRSPKKGRSPKRRASPEKTSFKTGVSYRCNHAYD